MIRLWKADFNGLMDELEDKGLLLKQHIREMEDELEKKRRIVEEHGLECEQLLQELNICSRELEQLEKDLKVSVLKEKDDIARMVIRKIKGISNNRKNIEQRYQTADKARIKTLEELSSRAAEDKRLKLAAKDYLVREARKRKPLQASDSSWCSYGMAPELSAEEVELELIKYKEMFQAPGKEDDHDERE